MTVIVDVCSATCFFKRTSGRAERLATFAHRRKAHCFRVFAPLGRSNLVSFLNSENLCFPNQWKNTIDPRSDILGSCFVVVGYCLPW